MLFTKASEYALLSLIYLAQKSEPKDAFTISNELGISRSFLAKILQNLAKDGILLSFKGANGGFLLKKSPDKITLLEIISSAERHEMSVFECSKSKESCLQGEFCKIWTIFNSIQMKVDDYLNKINLENIIKSEL